MNEDRFFLFGILELIANYKVIFQNVIDKKTRVIILSNHVRKIISIFVHVASAYNNHLCSCKNTSIISSKGYIPI